MGDHRAGTPGPTATTDDATPPVAGKRAARHSSEVATEGRVHGVGPDRGAGRPHLSQPYAGRRVARVAPVSGAARVEERLPYAGRRVAGRSPVTGPVTEPVTGPVIIPAPAALVGPTADPVHHPAQHPVLGRRIALDPALAGDADDVGGHLLRPTAAPTVLTLDSSLDSQVESYVGRRIADTLLTGAVAPIEIAAPERAVVLPEPGPEPEVTLTAPAPVPVPVAVSEPEPTPDVSIGRPELESDVTVVRAEPEPEPVRAEDAPAVTVPDLTAPVEAAAKPTVEPEPTVEADDATAVLTLAELDPSPRPATEYRTPRTARSGGRRVATRRTRIPSLPLLAGVAVLAISTCGALRAVNPDLAGADTAGRLAPASALSGSSAVGSANLLGGRDAVVSRDADREALSADGTSLQAAADQQAEQRDATLAALRGQAEKRAAQIKLHQWVLPITPGVYHLTARFGDYSSLWAHFHTGLDFAAPTGTPIMAVAGGTITEVGYSGAYGNRTIETLPDGTELWYCHQNQFGTSVGATVKPGQVIGYVGSTGNVTGPHLHLEVHPGGGDPVDPYAALVAHGLYPGPPA